MMKLKVSFFSLVIFILWINVAQAQIPSADNKTNRKGLRQKEWVILYDESWQETKDTSNVAYYRLIEYKNDKPIGKVVDYYRDGTVQMEAQFLTDRPETIYDGVCTWYRTDGSKQTVRHFKNKKLEEEHYYDRAGVKQDYDLEKEFQRASQHYNNKEYDSAGAILDQYYQEFYQEYKDDPNQLRSFYIALANTYYYKGDTTLYRIVARDVKRLDKKIAKQGTWEGVSEDGFEALNKGKIDRGIQLLEKALVLAEEQYGKDDLNYATALASIGTAHDRNEELTKAENYYREAIIVFNKSLVYRNTDYANCLSNLAGLQMSLGNLEKAEAGFREALKIYRKKGSLSGFQKQSYTAILSNLALVITQREGSTDEVGLLFKESLSIANEYYNLSLGLRNLENYFSSNINMARYYSLRKEYIAADSLNLKLLDELHEKKVSGAFPSAVLNNLAMSSIRQEKYHKAEKYLLESLKEVESISNFNLSVAPVFNLAYLYNKNENYSRAQPLFEEVIKKTLVHLDKVFPGLSETERSSFIEALNTYFNLYYDFGVNYYETKPSISGEIFDLRLKQKAIVFQSWKKMQKRILESNDEVLIDDYSNWQKKREELAQVYYLSEEVKKQYNLDLPKLEKEINALEKRLSLRSEEFVKTTENKTYDWRDVQQQLNKGEAIIDILRIPSYESGQIPVYLALLVTADTKGYPSIIRLEKGDALEDQYIRGYSNGIKYKVDNRTSYNHFWGKISPALEGIDKVYFSPEGVYHKINLLTLKNPSTEKYLGEELEIELVGSPRDLIDRTSHQGKKKIKGTQMYLFGYPDYKLYPEFGVTKDVPERQVVPIQSIKTDTTNRLIDQSGSISQLPGTKKEVEEISVIANKGKLIPNVYLNQEASEEKLKSLRNPGILHIATHGFFLHNIGANENSKSSFLDITNKTFDENPLLRSGILLAGAEQRLKGEIRNGEDGILTAYEAKNLYLDETDLVVLSACETGLGTIANGEGVYGLQRAFQQAGAKTIIMSLWNVSDKATQEFMALFYDHYLAQRQSKREAFSNAQNILKQKYPSPYFWGAFVIIGD